MTKEPQHVQHAVPKPVEQNQSAAGLGYPAVHSAPLHHTAAPVVQRLTATPIKAGEVSYVSDGEAMAVIASEARHNELYALSGKIDESNRKLEAVDSLVRLREEDSKITPPGSSTEVAAVGVEMAPEAKSEHDLYALMTSVNKTAKTRTTAAKIHSSHDRGLNMPADCGLTADVVTGNLDREVDIFNARSRSALPLCAPPEQSSGAEALGPAETALYSMFLLHMEGFIQERLQAGANQLVDNVHVKNAEPIAPLSAVDAANMYFKLPPAEQFEFDRFAGVNAFAMPEVGSAYSMVSAELATGFQSGAQRFWPFHWAGVVMTDGLDSVVLENFAPFEDVPMQQRQGMTNQEWEFQMYGSLDPDTATLDGSADEIPHTFYAHEKEKGLYGNLNMAMALTRSKPAPSAKAKSKKSGKKKDKGRKVVSKSSAPSSAASEDVSQQDE